jgi:hypothetical protein
MKYLIPIVILITLLLQVKCNKDIASKEEFEALLKSKEWRIAYVQETVGGDKDKVRLNISYPYDLYKIQFQDNDLFSITTNRETYLCNWKVIEDEVIILHFETPDYEGIRILSADWVLKDSYVWGYDQRRIILINNNIEIALL